MCASTRPSPGVFIRNGKVDKREVDSNWNPPPDFILISKSVCHHMGFGFYYYYLFTHCWIYTLRIKREAREKQEINNHTNDNKSTISTQIGINTL